MLEVQEALAEETVETIGRMIILKEHVFIVISPEQKNPRWNGISANLERNRESKSAHSDG